MYVVRSGTSVLGSDTISAPAAEKLADRLAGALAEDVPERNVHRGGTAHFDSGGAEAEIARECLRQNIDREWIGADKLGRGGLMDIGLDGGGPVRRCLPIRLVPHRCESAPTPDWDVRRS